MNTSELVQTIKDKEQDYESQEKITSLTELFRRSHNSWSVCGDTDAYVKRGSNRYIKSFVSDSLRFQNKEARAIDLSEYYNLLENTEITVEIWKNLSLKRFNNDGITATGRWCKKLQDNLKHQACQLKKWSDEYDQKKKRINKTTAYICISTFLWYIHTIEVLDLQCKYI